MKGEVDEEFLERLLVAIDDHEKGKSTLWNPDKYLSDENDDS